MPRRVALVPTLVTLLVLVGFAVAPAARATESSEDSSSTPPVSLDDLVVLDSEGAPTSADMMEAKVDSANRTIAVHVVDATAQPLALLLKDSWVRRTASWPGFSGATFSMADYSGTAWYRIPVSDPAAGLSFQIVEFRLEPGLSLYSAGSPASIILERPMLVTLTEVPRVETDLVQRSTANGSWTEAVPRLALRLGIGFEDPDTSGQTVTINRTWLGQYGLANPYFEYADGAAILNKSDEHNVYLFPAHFSVLYVFTSDESFTKEDDQTYSDVHWDPGNRDLYVYADRRDSSGTNERMRSPAPVTYYETTSFTVRATWRITQKGHWQYAVPLFFMGAANTRVDMANSVYVHYSSRDSNPSHPWYTPWYSLRYQDSTGALRVNHIIDAPANTQYEFMLAYDAYTRTMALSMYYADGTEVGAVSYVLPAGETFSLGKVGAGAWGYSSTAEPRTIAATDNILLDGTFARNGNFEADGNGDGVPDRWERWIWSDGNVYRSSTRARYGTWSVRVSDSSYSKEYGLQTNRMTAAAAQSYVGSAWVYVSSGRNALCIEFWNAMNAGSRLGVGCKYTATTSVWEYLDITALAPTGTVAVDLLVQSAPSNRGTGYFDGAELRRARSFWSIHVHTNNLPSPASWDSALDYVADLGMSYVRIDFVWEHFQPDDPAVLNWDHVAYWDQVIRMARARGLGITAILSGLPLWALWIRDCESPVGCDYVYGEGDLNLFFEKWRAFAQFIASQYGQDIEYYQLLNEENHGIHSRFPHEHNGEPRALHEAYQGLLLGTGATAVDHKSRFKTIVNAWADDLPGGNDWSTWLRDILGDSWGGDSIDVVAVDHYPGTWCCGSNYREWGVLEVLSDVAHDFGKEMAVMETGFSSYGWPDHDPPNLEAYVDQAMDEAFTRRNSLSLASPSSAFLLMSWYEFIDKCSDCGGWPLVENHFGILTYDVSSGGWGLKPAYDNLRYQVSRWH